MSTIEYINECEMITPHTHRVSGAPMTSSAAPTHPSHSITTLSTATGSETMDCSNIKLLISIIFAVLHLSLAGFFTSGENEHPIFSLFFAVFLSYLVIQVDKVTTQALYASRDFYNRKRSVGRRQDMLQLLNALDGQSDAHRAEVAQMRTERDEEAAQLGHVVQILNIAGERLEVGEEEIEKLRMERDEALATIEENAVALENVGSELRGAFEIISFMEQEMRNSVVLSREPRVYETW